jgi:ATP-dependent DNA helicase RecQ
MQNLTKIDKDNKYLSIIHVLKNILQRGTPTIASKYLQSALKLKDTSTDFLPLINSKPLNWQRIIKGDIENNNIPAKTFLEKIIPEYCGKYSFIKQLIIPEVQINDITQVKNKYFENQQVDFYFPQASLVIEIDGQQHNNQLYQDKERDDYLALYAIQTIRIKTVDIYNETDVLEMKINSIINRIELIIKNQNQKFPNKSVLESYQTSYLNNIDVTSDNKYKAIAIIRFQLLILELLENNILNFEDEWKLEVLCHDVENFCDLAIQDIFIWLKNLFILNSLEFKEPQIHLSYVPMSSKSIDVINIDFSLLQRYTDECQINEDVIYLRTDYFDTYRVLNADNPNNLKVSSFKEYDYFQLSTSKLIKYRLNKGKQYAYDDSLLFFIENIFFSDLQNVTFNKGQLAIIKNSLMGRDTIGLLPTGSGKSLCYQLVTMLQPTVNFVVCPIKSLMHDQKLELDSMQITRTNYITSDIESSEKNYILNNYSKGKYFCIFISPERFQTNTFREYLISMNDNLDFGYAVIDEVHCLSEWGHDFRTSYLNLADTIQKYMPKAKFIGLTATASIGVLRDIQNEFNIADSNVKYLSTPTRKELEFEVVADSKNNKYGSLRTILNETKYLFDEKEADYKAGIIFTQTVNGEKGCYNLSNLIKKDIGIEAKYFSGSIPKVYYKPIMSNKDFNIYKINTQKEFKENKFPLMIATKAFGMGVNKKNVHFTIHYGIPSSVEALYQEAGRAGRDKDKFSEKHKAKCTVLLTNELSIDDLQIWQDDVNLSDTKSLAKTLLGDLKTNFFMHTSSLDVIENEEIYISMIINNFCNSGQKNIILNGSAIQIERYNESNKKIEKVCIGKQKIEKSLYRLKQLGIIEDWTIENFFKCGKFIISCYEYDEEGVRLSLFRTISKYDSDFVIEDINQNDKYKKYNDILEEKNTNVSDITKCLKVLLHWSYDHFAGNRKQSLKNIYDNCIGCSSGKTTNSQFKQSIENYFKITLSTQILQELADNKDNYIKINDIFYSKSKNDDEKSISKRKQKELRDQLSRFLETYMNNTSLNIISGLLRLLLNDYDNADGRKRLENAMGQIKNREQKVKDEMLELILKIGNDMLMTQKNELSRSLSIAYSEKAEYIFSNLKDEYSLSCFVNSKMDAISNLNQRVKGLKWIS